MTVFFSRGGYLKKITPQSLRMASEQKFKEGDGLLLSFEATNNAQLLVFTDRCQCYKARLSDFADSKASVLGAYLPVELRMDEGENAIFVMDPRDYQGSVLFCFENGKMARTALSGFETKTNRKKLTGVYSDKSPLIAILPVYEEQELAAYSSDDRALVFSTAQLQPKTTKNTQGVAVFTLKRGRVLKEVRPLLETRIKNAARYRVRTLPGAGAQLRDEDREEEQVTFL